MQEILNKGQGLLGAAKTCCIVGLAGEVYVCISKLIK